MKEKTKKPLWKNLGTYFIAVLFMISIIFVYQIWNLNMIPIKYLLPGLVVFALLLLGLWWLQFGKKVNNVNKNLGKALIVIISVLLCVGNVLVYQARSALGKVSDTGSDTEVISVVVKKENSAAAIGDIKDGTLGITSTIDYANTQKALSDINTQAGSTIKTAPFDNLNKAADALYDGSVDAMVLNEAYRSTLDEAHPTFNDDTKVIYTYKIETETVDIAEKVDVTDTPFNVYISGIDTYGDIATRSRSDVNMLATVNPKTKQVLLTSIPRDYYVAQTCQSNQKDKLTHTGIFGVDCTVSTMEQFTGLTINYYARVNFSSLVSIVDAIGGVTVNNPNDFSAGGYHYAIGNIDLNGAQALAFSRERYSFADGDRQRGRNQMIVLTGIINKATSPAIITGYSSIMSAIGNSFQTNMTSNEMSSLVKMQLSEGGSWNIVQQSFNGAGENGVWSPANHTYSYMMYPDMDSVNAGLAKIKQVINGEIIQ